MAITLSDDAVRHLRLRAQQLDAPRPEVAGAVDPVIATTWVMRVVSATCGIQAQYMASAALAVRARSVGLMTAADVERTRVEERTIVRTWLMRGTLHLVATQDLGWILQLFGPRMIANDQRRRTQLGLDDATCDRALPLIRDTLAARGPLIRAELAEVLAPHGIPTAGQAMPHLLYLAAYRSLICFGPDRDGEPTYVLLDEWLGHAFAPTPHPDVPEEMKLTRLVIGYLHVHGPARPDDFATWAGVPLGPARAAWPALAPGLVEVEIGGQPAWMAKSHAHWVDELSDMRSRSPLVNLIPAYDPYLLGYQSRDLVVPAAYASRVHPGGGVLHNVVLVDGQARGIWRTQRRRDRLQVIVEPFAPLAPAVHHGLEAEVVDVGRFYATRAELVVNQPQ